MGSIPSSNSSKKKEESEETDNSQISVNKNASSSLIPLRIIEPNSNQTFQDLSTDRLSRITEVTEETESVSTLEDPGVITQQPFRNTQLIAFPARSRPKQPFMNTNVNQQQNQATLPAPPSYYRNEVTEEQHSPEQIRQRQIQQPRPEVIYSRSPSFQPGQATIMPNNLINVAYWAPYPTYIPPGIPACLAHLVAADSLFIVQQIDVIELFMSIDEPNFYLIQNNQGQCLYYAYETSTMCFQFCCQHIRGFQLHILDMYHNEIIYMNRPCGCNECFCCYPVMEVYSPPLTPVGAVLKKFHPTKVLFSVVDADENPIFEIHGPCFASGCTYFIQAEFTIHALDTNQTEVGIIKREYGGFVRNFMTNSDFYGITFPIDLDVKIKALFLGALFLIDYCYYEHK